MEKLNAYNSILLIDACVKAGIIQLEPNNPKRILIPQQIGDKIIVYTGDISTVALSLSQNLNKQIELIDKLRKRGKTFIATTRYATDNASNQNFLEQIGEYLKHCDKVDKPYFKVYVKEISNERNKEKADFR